MSNKLRERNLKIIKKSVWESPEQKAFQESFKAQHKVDIFNEAEFPVRQEGFSWKKLMSKLQEADSASSFNQFLRAGVQTITNAAYETTPTTYEDWVHVVQSKLDTELYAPNHGVAFPRQVGNNEKFPEVGVAALDIKLKNLKYGAIFAVERELVDDDQTGSFQRQAALLGEYMKILAEVLCYGKLASVSGMQYAEYKIPTSETKPASESVYPWSTGLVGGGATRPSAFAALSQASLQDGFIALMNQKNLQGLKMMVSPNRILIGPKYNFDSAVLLNSSYYPTGATAGSTGGAFAINPLKSLADITVSRFMFKNDGTVTGDSKAWYLVDDSKPWFIQQLREPVSVEQEAPNAGAAFENDVIRFKARTRMNADHIDPRFAWQGDDGSV